MSWILFSDSSTSVEILPAKNHKITREKISSEYRSTSGKDYRYTFGDFRRFEFRVEFVSSADVSQINSWWYSNTKLLLKESTDTQVFSVQFVDGSTPVAEFIRPLRDVFRGTINLETY